MDRDAHKWVLRREAGKEEKKGEKIDCVDLPKKKKVVAEEEVSFS